MDGEQNRADSLLGFATLRDGNYGYPQRQKLSGLLT